MEGTPYFLFPDGIKRLLALIPNVESKYLRLAGLIAISLGMIMLLLGRNLL